MPARRAHLVAEISVERNVMEKNEVAAGTVRDRFKQRGTFVIDLMASPGSGKTSLILATVGALAGRYKMGVIEGDIASEVDTQKVRAAGTDAVQINTGGLCHLDASMIDRALDHLPAERYDLVIIENVGNLVCPAKFDLGQDIKVVILSIPEGDDKPLKYPGIFTEASVLILNKIDMAGATNFDEEAVRAHVARLNPQMTVFPVSCVTGEGVPEWAEWLSSRIELTAGRPAAGV
jgi:hydrogenase nickel incorporation protein HypB